MFATPPRGLKGIEVSKVPCGRWYAAQLERGQIFKVGLSLGNFRSENVFDLFSRTQKVFKKEQKTKMTTAKTKKKTRRPKKVQNKNIKT